MKDILYITLKVQAAQNVSIQNDLKKINSLAQTRPAGPYKFCTELSSQVFYSLSIIILFEKSQDKIVR